MTWLASIDIRSDTGQWFTASAVRSSRKEAWEWLRSRLMWCDVVRIPRKGAKVCRLPPYQRQDPEQFSWCQGEECARDWQDPQNP